MANTMGRRAFLGAIVVGIVPRRNVPGDTRPARLVHPEPRPGIDASDVVPAERLRALGFGDDVVEIFDMVREMPHIADGLACYCGCALLGHRSLLTCFHEDGMAAGCAICQGEARLAYGRWKEGQTLDRIRRAIDARFAV